MIVYHFKGARRCLLDRERLERGETKQNRERNRSLNCRFPKEGKAYRLKGRARFKTGKKNRDRKKSSL